MQKQAEKLKAQIGTARTNLPLIKAENLPAYQERIRQMGEELALLEHELRQAKPIAEKDLNAIALEVVRNLGTLAYACEIMAKPGYVDEKGRRGVDNEDGTVTFGHAEQHAAEPRSPAEPVWADRHSHPSPRHRQGNPARICER